MIKVSFRVVKNLEMVNFKCLRKLERWCNCTFQGQIYALWEENQKLEERKEELELTLDKMRYLNALDEMLDVQVGLV